MQTEQQKTYKSNICVFLLEIHIFWGLPVVMAENYSKYISNSSYEES